MSQHISGNETAPSKEPTDMRWDRRTPAATTNNTRKAISQFTAKSAPKGRSNTFASFEAVQARPDVAAEHGKSTGHGYLIVAEPASQVHSQNSFAYVYDQSDDCGFLPSTRRALVVPALPLPSFDVNAFELSEDYGRRDISDEICCGYPYDKLNDIHPYSSFSPFSLNTNFMEVPSKPNPSLILFSR